MMRILIGLLAAASVTCPLIAQSTDIDVRTCWAELIAADSSRHSGDILQHRRIVATRLVGPAPTIDGRLDDAAWCQHSASSSPDVLSDFIQSRPVPYAPASVRTEARVLYDNTAIYVAVRLYDPAPDSVLAPLLRRDDEGQSDWVFAEFDSRHDRRTSFAFGLNPRGVQADGMYFDDRGYDDAWDGVWDGAVHADSLGWTAEFRIPFSQLPHDPAGRTWGFNIYRHVPHRGETSNWSPRVPTHAGIASIYNELVIPDLPATGIPLEVVPYTAVRSAGGEATAAANRQSVGIDLRARLTPGLQLTAAVRPDFGQVDADPSQVNLTAYQTFLPERRPLFVQGADIFAFGQPFAFSTRDLSFGNDIPFYSRRIGRPPRGGIPDTATLISQPGVSPILGAVKLSGRLGAWSVGGLDAWTGADNATARGPSGATFEYPIEALTHYSVSRLVRNSGAGERALGVFASVVDRPQMGSALTAITPRNSEVGGLDGRARFDGARYEVSGSILESRSGGVATTNGTMADGRFAKVTGDLTWSVDAHTISPRFNMNDVGFNQSADWILATGTVQYQKFISAGGIQRVAVGSQQSGLGWNYAGERRAAVLDAFANADLRNFWGTSLDVVHDFESLATDALRGGPALLLPPRTQASAALYTDQRRETRGRVDVSTRRERDTDSWAWSVAPGIDARLSPAFQLLVTPSASYSVTGWQYVAQPTDLTGAHHYIVGHLSEPTAAVTVQGTLALSPHLSVQAYVQPFMTTGRFSRFGEVTNPRAPSPADRVTWFDSAHPATVTFANPDFSERDFNSNLVLRWEFRPGSSLFVVWTQQRHDALLQDFAVGRDASRLFGSPARNVLAVKGSYWIRL